MEAAEAVEAVEEAEAAAVEEQEAEQEWGQEEQEAEQEAEQEEEEEEEGAALAQGGRLTLVDTRAHDSHAPQFICRTQWRAATVVQACVRGVLARRIIAVEKARLRTEADERAAERARVLAARAEEAALLKAMARARAEVAEAAEAASLMRGALQTWARRCRRAAPSEASPTAYRATSYSTAVTRANTAASAPPLMPMSPTDSAAQPTPQVHERKAQRAAPTLGLGQSPSQRDLIQVSSLVPSQGDPEKVGVSKRSVSVKS